MTFLDNLTPQSGRTQKISDEQLRSMHSDGLSDTQIAEIVGMAQSTIGARRRLLCLPPNATRRVVINQERLIELVDSGLSKEEIAREMGHSKKTIQKALDAWQLETAPVHLNAQEHGVLKECFEDGWPISEVSRTFGWSITTVQRAYGGKSPVSPEEVGMVSNAKKKYRDITGEKFW